MIHTRCFLHHLEFTSQVQKNEGEISASNSTLINSTREIWKFLIPHFTCLIST